MTYAEKLQALVRKAIERDWDAFGSESQQIDVETVQQVNGELQPDLMVDKPGIYVYVYRHHGTYSVSEVLFNHDFARALFGEIFVCGRDGSGDIDQAEAKDTPWRVSCNYENGDYSFAVEAFKYRLQQAVVLPTISEQIDYIYRAVFDD
jgi:hypothetical protein